jgi:hypothetical protein
VNQVFNPYHEFLGLDPQLTDPTYYQLLGLEPAESDPAQVTAAAERALARVRGCRPGRQAAAWARLLDELAAAKACLRDPVQKAAYDATPRHADSTARDAGLAHEAGVLPVAVSLPPAQVTPRAGAGAATPDVAPVTARNPFPPAGVRILDGIAVPPPPAAARHPQPPPVTPPVSVASAPHVEPPDAVSVPEPAPPGPMNAHVAPPAAQRSSSLPLAASLAAFFAVLTLIMLAVALRDRDAASTPAGPSQATSPGPATGVSPAEGAPAAPSAAPVGPPPAAAPVAPRTPGPPAAVPTVPASTDPPTLPPAVEPDPGVPGEPPATTPPAAEQVDPLLQHVRQLLATRKFAEAGRVLDQAAVPPRPPDQAARVERLRQLGQRAAEFWRLVEELAQRLQAAEEIPVGDDGQRVIVVEARPRSLTVRHEGRNLTYTPETLPPGLAVAIVRSRLGELDASQLVLLGACFATLADRRPEHVDQARRCWDQARAGGAAVDDLLGALDDEL